MASLPRPRNRRLLVFQVPERRRLKSGLYVGNAVRGSYSRVEDIWILNWASDCIGRWEIGMHGIVSSAFELEPTEFKLWDDFKWLVPECVEFVDECDGDVMSKLVHEESILAIYDKVNETKGEK